MPRPWKQATVDDAASELASLLTLSNETTTRKVASAFLTGHLHRPMARGPQPRQGSPPAPSPKGGYITPARKGSASPSRVRVNIIRGGGLPSSTKKPAPAPHRSTGRRSGTSSVPASSSPKPLPLSTASPPPSPPVLDDTRAESGGSSVATAPPAARNPSATNRASEPFGSAASPDAAPPADGVDSHAQAPAGSPATPPHPEVAAATENASSSSSGPPPQSAVPLGGVLTADPANETVEASATSSHLSSPDGSATAQRLELDPSSPFRADGSPHELVVPEVRFAVHVGSQTDLDVSHVAALERKVDAQAARIRELEHHLAELTAGLDDDDVDEEEMQRRIDAQLAEIEDGSG